MPFAQQWDTIGNKKIELKCFVFDFCNELASNALQTNLLPSLVEREKMIARRHRWRQFRVLQTMKRLCYTANILGFMLILSAYRTLFCSHRQRKRALVHRWSGGAVTQPQSNCHRSCSSGFGTTTCSSCTIRIYFSTHISRKELHTKYGQCYNMSSSLPRLCLPCL